MTYNVFSGMLNPAQSINLFVSIIQYRSLISSVVICLERGANDLHMVHLMPLPPHHLLLE